MPRLALFWQIYSRRCLLQIHFWQCGQGCLGPGPAYVTQNGWDLNLVNEVGQPSRAWIDYPGHVWAQYWNEGAVYSPDGMTIQFDNGSVWQRVIPPPLLHSGG